MSVVGLDFGNQNAVIAAAGRGGVDVILNGNSSRLNAAMIGFNESRSMGEAAAITASSNFRNTVKNMKRLIGLAFDDPRAQAEMKRAPFICVPMDHSTGGPASIGVKVNFNSEDTTIPIEAVAGMLVKHMGSIVKDAPPLDWVVTIPGYYTDAQRRSLLAGCKIAGLDGIQRLMHEHTAAALAYGIFKDIRKEFSKEKPSNVMFIDLGATSYSISIVAFEPGKLSVKTAQFDEDLGGRDFDQKIAEWIAGKFEEKYKGKLSAKPMEKPKVVIKLLSAAEKAKKTLSPAGVKEARINLESLMDDLDFNCSLTAAEYEEMCAELLARLNPPIQRALAETELSASDLASIEILGGGSRVGCVKRTLAKILGLDASATNNGLSTTLNADEAIARGAALQSAILSPRFKVLPYEIIECNPYPVKVSWEGDEGEETNSVVMFDRGSNFSVVRRITLRRPGEFTVNASYDDTAENFNYPDGVGKDIVTFKVKAPEGNENKIRVNVKQDIHGSILLSSAQMVEEIVEEEKDAEMKDGDAKEEEVKKEGDVKEDEAKTEKKKKIKKTNLEFSESRSLSWTATEIQTFNEKEVSMSNIDRIVNEKADMRNELESYIYDMRDKITLESQLASYGTEEEKKCFSDALEKTENWLYEDGFDAKKSVYAEKLDALKKHGDPLQLRQSETQGRPNAMAVLQRTVEKYQNWINTSAADEQFAHITDDEWSKAREVCDTTSNWMYEAMDKQGSLSPCDNPVVTVVEINGKSNQITKTISPIMHKPKPKPKVEEKKPEETPAEEKSEPMETDESSGKEGEKAESMDTKED